MKCGFVNPNKALLYYKPMTRQYMGQLWFYMDGTFHGINNIEQYWKLIDGGGIATKRRIEDQLWIPWTKHSGGTIYEKPHMIEHMLRKRLAQIDEILIGEE